MKGIEVCNLLELTSAEDLVVSQEIRYGWDVCLIESESRGDSNGEQKNALGEVIRLGIQQCFP